MKENELTTQVNYLTGKVNELTGERNTLTGRVNELTAERNSLLGEIGAPARADAALAGTQRSTTGTASRGGATGAHPVTPRKQRRAKFLNRCKYAHRQHVAGSSARHPARYCDGVRTQMATALYASARSSAGRLRHRPRSVNFLKPSRRRDQPVVGSKLILDLDGHFRPRVC